MYYIFWNYSNHLLLRGALGRRSSTFTLYFIISTFNLIYYKCYNFVIFDEITLLYDKVILTNVLELYIISLNKAKNNKENKQEKLYKWLEFINNPEEETRNGK